MKLHIWDIFLGLDLWKIILLMSAILHCDCFSNFAVIFVLIILLHCVISVCEKCRSVYCFLSISATNEILFRRFKYWCFIGFQIALTLQSEQYVVCSSLHVKGFSSFLSLKCLDTVVTTTVAVKCTAWMRVDWITLYLSNYPGP